MKNCPKIVGGAKVVVFTPIDKRHEFTGACKQYVAGELLGPLPGLAVGRYEGEDAYYLFGCDEEWNAVTDTWHQSLEEALEQAEFEYRGTKQTWQKIVEE